MMLLIGVAVYAVTSPRLGGQPPRTNSALVTLNFPAQPLARTLSELSEFTNKPLRAEAAIGKRIVLLNASATTIDSVMAKAAELLDGHWRDDITEFTLVRDRMREARRRQNALAIRSAAIVRDVAAFERSREPLRGQTPEAIAQASTRIAVALSGLSEGRIRPLFDSLDALPDRNLMASCAAAIPISELAAITSGSRVVYSNHPNARQLRLPSSCEPAVHAFLEAYGAYWSKLHRITREFRRRSPQSAVAALSGFERESAPSVDKTRVLFCVSREDGPSLTRPLLGLRLLAYEDSDEPFVDREVALPDASSGAELSFKGAKVALSPESRELINAINGFRTGRRIETSASLKQSLAHPSLSDPLALTPSELMTGIAKARGKNLFAWIPDVALADLVPNRSEVTVAEAGDLIGNCGDLDLREGASWVCISPSDAELAESHFTDRTSLDRLQAAASRGDPLPLGPTLEFVEANPGFSDADRLPAIVSEVVGGPYARLSLQSGVDWIRLFGSAARIAPAGLEGANGTRGARLDVEGREALGRLVDGPRSRLTGSVNGTRSGHIEPTEAIQDGFDDAAAVTICAEYHAAALRVSMKGTDAVEYVDLQALSDEISRKANPSTDETGRAASAIRSGSVQWLQPLQSTVYRISIDLGNGIGCQTRLVDPEVRGPRVRGLDQLPVGYRLAGS